MEMLLPPTTRCWPRKADPFGGFRLTMRRGWSSGSVLTTRRNYSRSLCPIPITATLLQPSRTWEVSTVLEATRTTRKGNGNSMWCRMPTQAELYGGFAVYRAPPDFARVDRQGSALAIDTVNNTTRAVQFSVATNKSDLYPNSAPYGV